MTRRTPIRSLIALLLVAAAAGSAAAEVKAVYRFHLANFSGTVPSLWARIAVDSERNEAYALDVSQHDVRIFGEHGMELFAFGAYVPSVKDITVGDDGSIYLLTSSRDTFALHRLDYRGEPVAEIALAGLPGRFAEFVAHGVTFRRGRLHLVDLQRMLVVVADQRGNFEDGFDLRPIVMSVASSAYRATAPVEPLQARDKGAERHEFTEITGFDVDASGSLYFTVATLFSAFKLFPDGTLWTFGTAGSGPGKFGVASGIAVDDAGYVYVADKLRSVVLVFDSDLEFQTEFGYRGDGSSNLIVPDDLAVDASGNLYIGQAANRGVSVFRIVHEAASPSQGIDTDSVISGKPARNTEETLLSERVDFITDQGTDPSEDNRR